MTSSPEIKIGKAKAYFLGLALSLLIYFIGQGIFFVNTGKAKGEICVAQYEKVGKYGEERIYYVCFMTKSWDNIKQRPDPICTITQTTLSPSSTKETTPTIFV